MRWERRVESARSFLVNPSSALLSLKPCGREVAVKTAESSLKLLKVRSCHGPNGPTGSCIKWYIDAFYDTYTRNGKPPCSAVYPDMRTQSLSSISIHIPKQVQSENTHKKKIISTPNILATSQRLPDTRDQYFSSSLCAPCTLSTTSSVFASIL